MAIKVYTYQKCSTCQKATRWLNEQGIDYNEVPIVESPPTAAEMKRVVAHYDGNIKRVCNSSGMEFRAQGIKDKVESLSDDKAIALLRENGMFIKRPFMVGDAIATGFRETEWAQLFS